LTPVGSGLKPSGHSDGFFADRLLDGENEKNLGKRNPSLAWISLNDTKEVEVMKRFWNRKSQKTKLHESGPKRRNPSYSPEMPPGSHIPDKGF
jgi:hypothetical protein